MRIVVMRDDFDKTLDADETVEFAIDGIIYTLDVTTQHAKQLRDDFARYIDAAHDKRKLREQKRSDSTPAAAVDVAAPKRRRLRPTGSRANPENTRIREWARANGYTVSDSRRIAGHIIAAYNAAHKGTL